MLISCTFQDEEEDRYSAQFDEGVNKKLYGTVRKINKESSTVVVTTIHKGGLSTLFKTENNSKFNL